MEAVVKTMTFDEERAYQQARENMITITELADVLARDYGVSFRTAHHKASIVSQEADKINQELYQLPLEKVNEWIGIVELSQEDWNCLIAPPDRMTRRNVTGDPNRDIVQNRIEDRN